MGSKTLNGNGVLYWPKHLRNKAKQTVQHIQQEELKRNLTKTDLRDAMIACVAEAWPLSARCHLKSLGEELTN